MGNLKTDWPAAKVEYIANPSASLEELAKKYGTTLNYIRKVATKGNWLKERELRWGNAEKAAIDTIGA